MTKVCLTRHGGACAYVVDGSGLVTLRVSALSDDDGGDSVRRVTLLPDEARLLGLQLITAAGQATSHCVT